MLTIIPPERSVDELFTTYTMTLNIPLGVEGGGGDGGLTPIEHDSNPSLYPFMNSFV
ncbi:MAG: hypothetical protein M3Q77_07430 [Thermoproteota archaeon]|nr:hypothetical protein [Nitrosopumilus sp.]MDQ3084629.1 hypothetical protein [Thermoproteota archaeon]